MYLLERSVPATAVIGGGLLAIIVAMLSVQADAAAGGGTWWAMLAGISLLAAAVVGMYRRTRPATGRLGLASAWLSGFGALATVAAIAYFAASGEIVAMQQALPDGPVGILAMGASLAWLAGNLGFAAAIARTRALPRAGAWLVLVGAALPISVAPFTAGTPQDPLAQLGTMTFLLLPAGWIVLGIASTRRPALTSALVEA